MSFEYLPQELNEATSVYAARLDAYLQSLGEISIRDAVLSRRQTVGKPRLELTLDLVASGTASFRVSYFTASSGQSVDVQVAAFFAANEGRICFIFDVSEDQRRYLDHDAVMIIWTLGYLPNAGYDRGRTVVVRAVAQIAAGAQGQARMVMTDGGLSDPFTVTNRSGSTWAASGHGYAQARPQTAAWDAYPSCCDVV